jgi:hypothetical protein
MPKPQSNLRTQAAEKWVEDPISLPFISEFVFRSPQTIDSSQKEVADLLVSQGSKSILISQKCQEDPSSRDSKKAAAWAIKKSKNALAQLRGAFKTVKAKKPVWCEHRRRGRVEFQNGLPPIDFGIVITEISQKVELGPESNFPLILGDTPIAYLSVNDFLNLANELRTLPEIMDYLKRRQVLPKVDLRTIGDEKRLFEHYLINDGSFLDLNVQTALPVLSASGRAKFNKMRASKAESDRYTSLIEYVADQLATRLPTYASGLPAEILSAFDDPDDRSHYMEMQGILANLRLRERAELGRAFTRTILQLKGQSEGLIFAAFYFDTHPDLVFVLASSKGISRPKVLEQGLVLMRAARAHYKKSRAMLILDRDGSGFEISLIASTSGPTEEEIEVGKRLFGGLKIFDRQYSFTRGAV